MIPKRLLQLGAVFALLAVVFGAFGAHTLERIVSPGELETFEIGVRYQFYHAFALLIAGLLSIWRPHRFLRVAGWLFAIGILFFSGSLYLLAIDEALGLSLRWLGPVTPIGGTLFILGWAYLFLAVGKGEQGP
jgi:uncharacterized membrane protein YgdD (TMEM256/DUF423 family)